MRKNAKTASMAQIRALILVPLDGTEAIAHDAQVLSLRTVQS